MNRGEVWLINLDPTIGAEIKKTRPAVIVNSDAMGVLPLRVIVPLTDWNDRYTRAAWMVKVSANARNGLTKDSAADSFQIRSLSTARFIRKVGDVDLEAMDRITKAVGIVVEHP